MRVFVFLVVFMWTALVQAQGIRYFVPSVSSDALAASKKQGKQLCYLNIVYGCGGGEQFERDVLTEQPVIDYLNEHYIPIRAEQFTPDEQLYPAGIIKSASSTFIIIDENGDMIHQFGIYDTIGPGLSTEEIVEELNRAKTGTGVLAGKLQQQMEAGDHSYETLHLFCKYVGGNSELAQSRIAEYIFSVPFEQRFNANFVDMAFWLINENRSVQEFLIVNQDTLRELLGTDMINGALKHLRTVEARYMEYAGVYDYERLRRIYAKDFERFVQGIEFKKLADQYWADVNDAQFWPVFKAAFLKAYADTAITSHEANSICWQGYWTSKIIGDSVGLKELLEVAIENNNRRSGDAFFLNTLAHLQYDNGLVEEAIATQKQCVIASEGSYYDPGFISFMADELKLFKQGKPIVPKM